jgi:hypothetical protein
MTVYNHPIYHNLDPLSVLILRAGGKENEAHRFWGGDKPFSNFVVVTMETDVF